MNNEAECWKNYIRKCILSKSFYIPQVVSRLSTCMSSLLPKVFPTSSAEALYKESQCATESKRDSILQSYRKAIRGNSSYRKCVIRMQNEVWELIEEDILADDDKDDDEGYYEETDELPKFYDCQLEVKNLRQAIGNPIDVSASPITINGYNKGLKKGAFNGDIVKVQLVTCPQDENTDTSTTYGKIVDIIESRHPNKYVCKADRHNPIDFFPLDKTMPIFVNLPLISNMMLQHGQKHDLVKSQKQYITIFAEESLEITDENSIPRPKDLIPLELASQLLFVVKLIGWKPAKYRKPLGAVVEAFPRSTKFFTKKLLQLANEVITTEDEDSDSGMEYVEEVEDEDIYHSLESDTQVLDIYDHAFTIDVPKAQTLDNAISLIPIDEANCCYKLAILITDVAKHIDEHLDKQARAQGTTFYGTSSGCIHMLPSKYSKDHLSLLPLKVRDAIAITANVDTLGEINVVASDQPELTKVMSRVKLSYESAQRIIDNQLQSIDKFKLTHEAVKQFDSNSKSHNCLSMRDTLLKLYDIARHFRIERLGEAGYAYQVSDAGEEAYWQAHLLVEELMIWANQQVAGYMKRNIPNVLLRRQLAPSTDERESLINQIEAAELKGTIAHSFTLKSLCPSQDTSPLHMTVDTLQQLKNQAVEKAQLLFLLFTDQFYPKLAAINSVQARLSKAAEYICTQKGITEEDKIYGHYSLKLDQYTHFTSPIGRYCDIAVQKLVTALIQGDEVPYKEEMIHQLCRHLNLRTKLSNRYEKDMKGVEVVSKCEKASLLQAQAFLVPYDFEKSDNKFQLCFPSNEFNFLKSEYAQFQLSHLCLNSGKWSVISASLHGPEYLLQANGIGKLNLMSTALDGENIKIKIFYSETMENENDCSRAISYYSAPLVSELVEVPADVWSLGQQCVITPTDENISTFINRLPAIPDVRESKSINEVHRNTFSRSPYVAYDIEKSLPMGTPVNVWVGRSLAEPIPTPHVSLIEIAPTVQICLDHSKKPAICFSDVQLKQASKSKYCSLEEYVDLWSKVFVAEAAFDGVDDVEVIQMIRGVTLEWGELIHSENSIDDVSYVLGPNQVVSFEMPNYRKQNFGFIQMRVGNLVCARYIDTMPSSIYHFVVSHTSYIKPKDREADGTGEDVDDDGSDIMHVELKAVGDHSCLVSPEMKASLEQKQRLCDLQVIKMPDSFR